MIFLLTAIENEYGDKVLVTNKGYEFEGGSSIIIARDELGRVHTVQDCLGNITTYEYDDNNNVTAIVYPDNTRVTMEYDARNRLKAQKDAYGNATTYTYDVCGQIEKETRYITYSMNGYNTKK